MGLNYPYKYIIYLRIKATAAHQFSFDQMKNVENRVISHICDEPVENLVLPNSVDECYYNEGNPELLGMTDLERSEEVFTYRNGLDQWKLWRHRINWWYNRLQWFDKVQWFHRTWRLLSACLSKRAVKSLDQSWQGKLRWKLYQKQKLHFELKFLRDTFT